MQINALEYLQNKDLRDRDLDKICIVDNQKSLSFGQLEFSSNYHANQLIKEITDYNCPIAVLLPKSAEVVVANISILKTGNFYSNLDVKAPIERLKLIINNLKPKIIITNKVYEKLALDLGCNVYLIESANLTIPGPVDLYRECKANIGNVIDSDPICVIYIRFYGGS